tara:strand:+ start:475 stop:858 length:384 start_codon:yes stop_codon:yes gene_type:complete
MSGRKINTWLLAEPKKDIKFGKKVIKEAELDILIKEAVLDTIRPYGSSEHKQDQYKKIEKYDHLLDTISKNLRNLVESVKSDLSYGYLSAADAEFIVNDHFERVMDSISFAGSAIIASIGKEDEENY